MARVSGLDARDCYPEMGIQVGVGFPPGREDGFPLGQVMCEMPGASRDGV